MNDGTLTLSDYKTKRQGSTTMKGDKCGEYLEERSSQCELKRRMSHPS